MPMVTECGPQCISSHTLAGKDMAILILRLTTLVHDVVVNIWSTSIKLYVLVIESQAS